MKVLEPRKIVITGGVLAGTALVAASFSSSMAQLAVWFALFSIGMACIQVASVKPIMDYFPDNFATANGVSLAGGTVGVMVLPPVVEYLVSLYGWRTAFALLGVFSYNYVVCGALLRPLHRIKQPKYRLVPSQTDAEDDTCASKSRKRSDNQVPTNNTSCASVKTVFLLILEAIRDQFDTKLLAEPIFIVYQVVNVLNGMVYSTWHLFLIPQGLELGYGETPSAFLATYAGVGSLIGRLGHGTLVDRGLTEASTLLALSSLLFAAACGLNPLAVSSYAALAALAFVSGIAIGIMYPIAFVLMREITGDQRTSAYSWLFLSHGAGQLLGGFFAGWVHDITAAYEFVFLGLCALAVTMAAILVLIRCLLSCCEVHD